MSVIALSLRYLSWPQAAMLALTALIFNYVALARVMPGIIRPTDARGARAGVLFYPLSVLVLILIFRDRLDIVAGAWGVMAFGDGAATLLGIGIGGPKLPWNPEKTWSGLASFATVGATGAWGLVMWTRPAMLPLEAVIAAAIVAALVETIPIKLDDNLSVPFAAAATLVLVSASSWTVLAARLVELWPSAVGVNVVMALAAWLRGSLTATGSVVGTILGIVIYVAGGPWAWALLFVAFAVAVISSRIGKARKADLVGAEVHEERRGAGNALANCLVGAIGAWLIPIWPDSAIGPLILIAGLVAGASDTVASEIGKAFGGTPRTFPSFAAVPAGTPGAISAVGTSGGLISAVLMAVAADSFFGVELLFYVVVGATVGAFVESALAARFEERGILNNDVLNFINTAVAASVAVGLWRR